MRLVFEVHGGVEIDYSIGGSNNSFSEKARNAIESLGHECVNALVIKSELSDNIELFLAEIFGGNSEDYNVLEKSIRCETTDENFKIHGFITFDVSKELEEEFDWSEYEFDYSDIVSSVFDESINLHGELINLDPLYKAMGDDVEIDFTAQYFEKHCEATLYLE
jgi:hypothetical protein